jgi:hypothetical protein
VLVAACSQVFSSLAFVLAESVEGAWMMRLQTSTRCLGVSGGEAAVLVEAPLEVLPAEASPLGLVVAVVAVLDVELLLPDVELLLPDVELLLPDVELLLPPPHPARSATPRSARTRQLNIFRTNDPFLRRTLARRLPVEGRHLIGCSDPAAQPAAGHRRFQPRVCYQQTG